jgi:hypothetical protein
MEQKKKSDMQLKKEKFIALALRMFEEMDSQLNAPELDFYEYEKRFETVVLEFSRNVLEQSLSETEVAPHKKKKYSLDLEPSSSTKPMPIMNPSVPFKSAPIS